jgi:hypothetical protein
MQMFATLDKSKSTTESIGVLNLAAFELATVRVTKLPF